MEVCRGRRPDEQTLYRLGYITPGPGIFRRWARVQRIPDILVGAGALEIVAPSLTTPGEDRS